LSSFQEDKTVRNRLAKVKNFAIALSFESRSVPTGERISPLLSKRRSINIVFIQDDFLLDVTYMARLPITGVCSPPSWGCRFIAVYNQNKKKEEEVSVLPRGF